MNEKYVVLLGASFVTNLSTTCYSDGTIEITAEVNPSGINALFLDKHSAMRVARKLGGMAVKAKAGAEEQW